MRELLTLVTAVVASADHVVVLARGGNAIATGAVEAWHQSLDRGEQCPVKPRRGYPTVVPTSEHPDLDPGGQLAVLGSCSKTQAWRIARTVLANHPGATTIRWPGHPFANSCPSFVPVEAASVIELAAKLRKAATDRTADNTIDLCSRSRAQLTKRYGDDVFCRSLWGMSCADYTRVITQGRLPSTDPCAFLTDAEDSRLLLRVTHEGHALRVCTVGGDDAIAWVFADNVGIPYPADVMCGHGDGYTSRLGAVVAIGVGACVEYVRAIATERRRRAWLRCYVPTAARPFAIIDELPVTGYAVASSGGELTLCTRQSDGVRALRLTARGFEPHGVGLAECNDARYKTLP